MDRNPLAEDFSYIWVLETLKGTDKADLKAVETANRQVIEMIEQLVEDGFDFDTVDEEAHSHLQALSLKIFAQSYLEAHPRAYADMYNAVADEGEPSGEWTLGMLGAMAEGIR